MAMRALWVVISNGYRASPVQSLLCLCESASVLLSVVQPVFLAWLVMGAVEHDRGQLVAAVVLIVGSIGAEGALKMIGRNARVGQLERVSQVFNTWIAVRTARIPTLDHLETPRYLDRLQMLREEEGNLGVGLNILLNCFTDLVRVGGTLAIAASADWRLLLIAAAGMPSLAATRWFVRWQAAAERAAAASSRRALHFLDLGMTAAPGAELRVFGLARFLHSRLRREVRTWRRPFVVQARRTALLEIACGAFYFSVAGAVLGWIVSDVIAGSVPLGALVLAVMLINRLQDASTSLQESIRKVGRVIRAGGWYLWLVEYEREVAQAHRGTIQPRLRQGIRLENVTYLYADSDRTALDAVSLDLPAGSVIAVVGENGAGKSTLVKLLAGLYRPSAGRILIDDVDLTDIDLLAWRRRISGAFQDYATIEVTAGEAVGVGDLPRLDDEHRIQAALRAGAAEDVVRTLPEGLGTQLGTVWPGGVGLSGGQWQRLALARGMMRPSPLLLVLDEPTAALDALTEHALFERYAAASRQAAVTLLVTHRFSTAASADRIVVLDRGRIVEEGTHAELLAAGGHYAELYHLQARGYS